MAKKWPMWNYRSFKFYKLRFRQKKNSINYKDKSTACGTNARLSGAIILLKILVKKGHNSKTIAFTVMPLVLQLCLVMMNKGRNSKTIAFTVMPLVLQLCLVMMNKYSMFAWQRQPSDQNSSTFSSKQTS